MMDGMPCDLMLSFLGGMAGGVLFNIVWEVVRRRLLAAGSLGGRAVS